MSGEAAMVSCSAGASELAHFPEQTQLRCGSQLCEHSHHPCAELHPEPHEGDDFATEVRYARAGLDRMFIGENFTESLGPVTSATKDGSRSRSRGSRRRSPVTLRHQSVGQARLSESITDDIDSIIPLLEREEVDTTSRMLLEKRILHYFDQGAKGLEFGQKTFKELVHDYADAVYSSMFSAWAPIGTG